ncbi:MAG: hypothetical protein JOZ37_05650 [Actinobacteria bacterium]|nr:hypothetical protein [Actinomycetota bacterium]MBV8958012.1 hypothetical protein [Actinomycetota bacterium]MBV9663431.1 hypothetical protein [Actinomycetota bacterium]
MADNLDALEPFIGTWTVEAVFPGDMSGTGTCTFEWMDGKRFLVQRTSVPDPAPDSLAIIGPDEATGAYRQHYFDTRGVARVYAMTFDGNLWELTRTEADFSPLDFSQRFTGTVADGGDTIIGAWQTSDDGVDWKHDFDLTYRRTT